MQYISYRQPKHDLLPVSLIRSVMLQYDFNSSSILQCNLFTALLDAYYSFNLFILCVFYISPISIGVLNAHHLFSNILGVTLLKYTGKVIAQ